METEHVVDILTKHFGEDKREEIAETLDDQDGEYSSLGAAGSFEADGTEYAYIESKDEAERIAIDVVKDDLENDPEIFNQDFIQQHIEVIDAETIGAEAADSQIEDMRDDLSRRHYGDVADFEDWVASNYPPADDASDDIDLDDREDLDMNSIIDEFLDGKHDEIAEEIEEEIKEDPIQYFSDKGYSLEDALKQNLISIDIDAAAEEAVSVDGWAHFLSRYDGNYEELDQGLIIFRR